MFIRNIFYSRSPCILSQHLLVDALIDEYLYFLILSDNAPQVMRLKHSSCVL